MSDLRSPKLSIRGPVTLFVLVIVLIITVSVLWNVVLVHDYRKLKALAEEEPFHWSFIALGSVMLLTIIVLSSLLSSRLIGQIRWNQRQSNFISSVSHELNSPLSSIKLFAQTLRNPNLSPDDRLNFVSKILADVERLHRLIANILRAAETDYRGDHLQVVPQRLELTDYLRGFVADATQIYGASRLSLELVAEDDYWVRLDPIMFRQVLDNLLDNAVRYRGGDDPRVTLSLAQVDDPRIEHAVEVRVRDHGVGIPPEELPKLFERFYRIEQTRYQRKGTGIGLFVVRSIIAAHGGRVGAESEGPGHGSTFWIRLPEVAGESARQAAASPSGGEPRGNGEELLASQEISS